MRFGQISLAIGSWLNKAIASGSTLLNGLVSYWALDETSGVRYDSVGENDLTDNNTVGVSLRGPEGTVASFVAANSEKLTRADTTGTLGNGVSRTFSFWWRDTTAGTDSGAIIARDNATTREWAIYTGNTVLFMLVFDSAGNPVTIDSFSDFTETFAKSAWHHGVVWYDFTDSKIYYQVDGGTVRSKGTVDYVRSGTGPLEIGASTYYNSANLSLGPIGMWSRVLTADERAALFNSGNGVRYEDLSASVKTDLTSWWELDEVSGTRVDSHGSNDLTDNNTVGSVNTGPLSVVPDFVGSNSESLGIASFVLPDVFTLSMWVKPDPTQTWPYPTLFSCNNASWASEAQFTTLIYNNSVIMIDYGDGSTFSQDYSAGITLDVWSHLAFVFDSSKKVTVYRNGEVAAIGPALPGTPYRTAAPLAFGGGMSYAIAASYLDGRLAPAGLWSRELDVAEIKAIGNFGVGKKYADLTTDEKVGLVSYWNLDEQSGVRYDSHGTNHLTDNNTVGSVINAGGAMGGGAASFVAANSESLTANFDAPTTYTISLWINEDTAGASGQVIGFKEGLYGRISWMAETASGSFYVAHSQYDGIGWQNNSGWIGTPNEKAGWCNVIATCDATAKEMRLFINGTEHTDSPHTFSGTVGNFAGTNRVKIGALDSHADPLLGADSADWSPIIDEVAIWNRVLTADERAELYAAGAGKFYPFEE